MLAGDVARIDLQRRRMQLANGGQQITNQCFCQPLRKVVSECQKFSG
jgi:hypothetical protein